MILVPGAATATPPPELTLQEALDAAVSESYDVRRSLARVRFGEGDLAAAQALFDGTFLVSSARSRLEAATLSRAQVEDQTALTFGFQRRLRFGPTWSAAMEVGQTGSGAQATALNAGTLGLGLGVPLFRDRGARGTRSLERAAEENLGGDHQGLRHQQAVSAFETVAAYWSYVAAREQLEVFQDSQQRAQRLVEEMRDLVRAEQRPAADIAQVEGNAAAKVLDRLAAEQAVVESRRRLGLAMGIPADRIATLPAPADPLPSTAPFTAEPATVSRLERLALDRRADLEANRRSEAAATLRLAAASDSLRPRLDLELVADYSGIEAGTGLDSFFGGLHRNVPGASFRAALVWERPVQNLRAEGELLRGQGVLDDHRLLREDLERTVVSGVAVACQQLERSYLSTETAARAVARTRETVDNEKLKNRLGMATLFDVILAEDNLTGARLGEAAARESYALALARLRFQTGTLATAEGGWRYDATLLSAAP